MTTSGCLWPLFFVVLLTVGCRKPETSKPVTRPQQAKRSSLPSLARSNEHAETSTAQEHHDLAQQSSAHEDQPVAPADSELPSVPISYVPSQLPEVLASYQSS